MNEFVLSIDVGSAFTKVSIRVERNRDVTPVNSPISLAPIPDLCFPSGVVLADGQHSIYGSGAMRQTLRPHQQRVENWKRELFSDVPPPPRPSGWDALFAAEDFRRLVQEHGIPAAELEALIRLSSSARAFAGVPSLSEVRQSLATSVRADAREIAAEFLKWIRGQLLESLRSRSPTFPDLADIPVRVTVPAFAPEAQLADLPGCRALADALQRSGWKLHPERPFISEPLANAIGVLTQGRNSIAKRRRDPGRHDLPPEKIDMPTMFGSRSPIVVTDKNSSKSGGPFPVYRAFVIDLGAFTADFALVELNPNNGVIGDIVEALAVRLHSIPLGVFDLDRRMKTVFTAEQQSYISASLTPFDWEDIRKKLYSDRVAFRLADGSSLGGGAQRPAVDEELHRFGTELASAARIFFDEPLPEQSAELIFTGGGMNIPAVRERVQSVLENAGHKFQKVHFPTDGKPTTPGTKTRPGMVRLSDQLARGGSAIGGASVFFEPAFQPS